MKGALGLMMVRDEGDVIGTVVSHLAAHVDGIWIFDNGSTDGTVSEIQRVAEELRVVGRPGAIWLRTDEDPAYWQARKMTAWAREACADGWDWIVPCDADEIWYCPNGQRVADYLASQALDVQIVRAELFNHCPSYDDDPLEPDPIYRLEHRLPVPGSLPKVACRAHPTLEIEAGNHGARYFDGVPVGAVPGLAIRHFSWRSPEQYLRKVRNGVEAYKLTNLHSSVGEHWRMWEGVDDETILAHFRRWFEQPAEALVHDPAPVARF